MLHPTAVCVIVESVRQCHDMCMLHEMWASEVLGQYECMADSMPLHTCNQPLARHNMF